MPAEIAEERGNAAPQVRTQNRKLVFTAALASVVITAIESTIVSTSMPTVVAQLGGFDLLSWVFTAYLLTQAITVPIYGRLSDLYGRKPILLTGVGFFAVGSLLCGFAPSMFALVLFRTVQGFGSGALVSVGRTLIGDIFNGPERARMQGVVSSGFIGAGLLGPMIGAFLVTHTIWPMIFWVNVPIALAAGAILLWGFHERIEKRRHRIDWGGALLICLGTGLLMVALSQSSSLSLALKGGLLATAIALLLVFVLYERNVAEPIWPMSLFRDRVASSGNLVSLATGATTLGLAAYLPVYIQGVIGASASVSGIVIMALSIGGPLGAATAGQIMLRASYRTSASIGAALYIVGSILMTLLTAQSHAAWAAAGGFLIGLGMGMNNNTYLVAVQSESAWNQRGIATSALMFTRILGQAIGA
ncbi:MAG TPA: MFS transporter, partial [Stellaceae bacterium]|nr:MFS transporter [Stellaceae bacterium]